MSGAGAGVVILTGCALVPGAALYRQLFPGEWCWVEILTGCALVPGAALYRSPVSGAGTAICAASILCFYFLYSVYSVRLEMQGRRLCNRYGCNQVMNCSLRITIKHNTTLASDRSLIGYCKCG